MEGGVTCG